MGINLFFILRICPVAGGTASKSGVYLNEMMR